MIIPKSLIQFAQKLSRLVSKAKSSKPTSKLENEFLEYWTSVDDAGGFVSSFTELSKWVHIDTKTLRKLAQQSDSPMKGLAGHCIHDWECFLKSESPPIVDVRELEIGSQRNLKALEIETAKALSQMRAFEERGSVFEVERLNEIWLQRSKALREFEVLNSRHNLEVGETIEVDQCLDCISISFLSMCRAFEMGTDRICKLKVSAPDPATFKASAEKIYREAAIAEFNGALSADILPAQIASRVAEIFGLNAIPKTKVTGKGSRKPPPKSKKRVRKKRAKN